MRIIVGLGNPGYQYEDTRHNMGFMVVDRLSRELTTGEVKWESDERFRADVVKGTEVFLVKPKTYMNNSGVAVKKILDYYKLKSQDLWVVHDDIDLPLGKIRIRSGGGSAGHNGVTSIIQHLKTDDFVRFRLGIGHGKEAVGKSENKVLHHRAVIDFVLSRFTQHEAGSLKHLVKNGTEAVRVALLDGLDKAMNRFN